MFRIVNRNRKLIAAFFLLLILTETVFPSVTYALTSGPVQPEMQKFEPAGAGDMVDLFSGDLKYNIPLMDVGGYPVNLSYHSGNGMEDEAGWVGMGWTLNPGVMNRSMRGIPDDFSGDKKSGDQNDVIKNTFHKRDFKKIGGQLVVKPTVFGWERGSASLHLGIYKDNYYGIGGEVGASLSFNVAQSGSTSLTAGLGLNSDTRTGVTVSPSFSLTTEYGQNKELNNLSLSGGFSYNTRSGLEQVNLGQSFTSTSLGTTFDNAISFTKYFSHSYTPTFGTSTTTTNNTFNLDLGPQIFGGYVGIGGSAYIYTETNAEPHSAVPAYGYLNYAQGKNNMAALLDFNRERDMTFMPGTPAIPIPVATEDYFEANSQAGSQQFRPFYNGNYTIFDRTFTKTSKTLGAGLTFGAGAIFQAGARVDVSSGQGTTHKWVADNGYLSIAEPPPYSGTGSQLVENTYFKETGLQTRTDDKFYGLIGTDVTERAAINNKQQRTSGPHSYPNFQSAAATRAGAAIQRIDRDIRTSNFSYLTAAQASVYGLDKTINGTPRVNDPNVSDPAMMIHKAHHISEVTVTDREGKRMVYGIPVYNTDQEEVTFSVNTPANLGDFETARRTGLIKYTPGVENSEGNQAGRENLFTKKIIPSYATSYLLTGILSPDYVDMKGDGITDDDLGTAVKFKYTKLLSPYKWRAPFEQEWANYNEGFLSDTKDDKASYVYGQKEVWYMQSIESKTMVAQFFTSPRKDGLGVLGENGGADPSVRLQKLDSVRLFSKADLIKNSTHAIPVKVVHFEYDYSLYPGVTNNSQESETVPDPADPAKTIDLNTNKGKLTLKKVYFTFGVNARGKSNPYIFSYISQLVKGTNDNWPASDDLKEAADQYVQRETDRWGTYKQGFYNHLVGGQRTLNNGEYPYSLQVKDNGAFDERQLADRMASKWQLNKIITPTGGIISVEYESDDYAYVQDRKAMQMCTLAGVGALNQNTGLNTASKLYVTLPVGISDQADFVNTYLGGPNGQPWNNIFFKILTDLDNKGHNEFVYGYAELGPLSQIEYVDEHTVGLPVKPVNSYNPVSKAAWQMVQDELPQYAYENYDNSDVNSLAGNIAAAVRAIIQSFANLRELFQSFDKTASGKHYANKVDLSKSFIRLDYPVGKPSGNISGNPQLKRTYGKLGGGSRVRKVEISDDWNTMSGIATAKTATYGMQYDYTTLDDKNNTISSGVASYEPQIGNEENPFHEPVNYTEKVQWGLDRYHCMEKPFGESYFPAPMIGYSVVKATAYGADYSGSVPDIHKNTGYTVSEFYTARDFPTRVDNLPLDMENYQNNLTLSLFASSFIDKVATSQGYKVILNDMHGKQKSTKIYGKGGTLITSSEYFYNVDDDNAQQKRLNNTVLTLDTDGTIPAAGKLIGTDAELITDVRESTSDNTGTSVGAYAGAVPALFIPIPYAGFNFNHTSSKKSYNSISSIKVIHQYGTLKKVRTIQNGSSITNENMLWDAYTGDVLLIKAQNEFNDYTYAFHYPAYMAYSGMGGAYKTLGTIFSNLSPGSNGLLTGTSAGGYLFPGDELIDIDAGVDRRGWAIQSDDGSLRLIDKDGTFITGAGNYLLVRGGRRNMLTVSAGTVITMNNPLVTVSGGYAIQEDVTKKILDAKAVTFKDEWAVAVDKIMVMSDVRCANLTPVVSEGSTSTGIYYVENTPSEYVSCYGGLFFAETDLLSGFIWPGRSYADFGVSNIPANAVIQSVKLSLYAATDFISNPTSGDNAFTLKRVIEVKNCDNVKWNTKPSITDANAVLIPKSTSTAQDYPNIDVTGMFKDWYFARDIPSFRMEIAMVNELTSAPKRAYFDGSGPRPMQLSICYTVPDHCVDAVTLPLNPYFRGVKGNWQPDASYTYQVNRTQEPGLPNQKGGTNIRTSGYYSSFTPFWVLNNHSLTDGSASDARWVWGTRSVYFDQKGNEIENVDALQRYSAALFGYRQSVPTAKAINARHNEIAFDGFEDYGFTLQQDLEDPCPAQKHLDLGTINMGGTSCSGNCLVTDRVHSGNYSLKLGTDISITKSPGNAAPPSPVLGYTATGQYQLLANEQAAGFSPVLNRKYLLSVWVKDGNAQSNHISGLDVTINGSLKDVSGPTVPVVEGWKKLDLSFTGTDNFTLLLHPSGGNIYIDDLRILPFDGELKSFVYDDRNMRLKAQLDENNFATFFEYDDDGNPIRVKKETERGVMTVKELRQSLRQPKTVQ